MLAADTGEYNAVIYVQTRPRQQSYSQIHNLPRSISSLCTLLLPHVTDNFITRKWKNGDEHHVYFNMFNMFILSCLF